MNVENEGKEQTNVTTSDGLLWLITILICRNGTTKKSTFNEIDNRSLCKNNKISYSNIRVNWFSKIVNLQLKIVYERTEYSSE